MSDIILQNLKEGPWASKHSDSHDSHTNKGLSTTITYINSRTDSNGIGL